LTVEKRNTDNRDNIYRDQDNTTKRGVAKARKSKSSSRNGSLDMSNQSSDDGVDRSKDAGHFVWNVGMILGVENRYEVLAHLGDGTFGRALKCRDTKTNANVAVKIVRAVSRYAESSKIEANILRDLKTKGGCEKNIVDLRDFFEHKSAST
jgi:serine/threonine protein kinase